MLDHRQRPGGNTRLPRRADPVLRRRGGPGRGGQPRLRRSGQYLELSRAPSGDPEDLLHGLGPGRQAPRRPGRPAHEARHHGARRPQPGDRIRRRRSRCGHQGPGLRQVPQRRASLRVAHALHRPGEHLRRIHPALHRGSTRREGRQRPRRGHPNGSAGQFQAAQRHRGPGRRRCGQRAPRSRPADGASATRAISTSPRCCRGSTSTCG